MKHLKYLFIALFLIAFTGCQEDDGLLDVQMGEPSNISADFIITHDNTGTVTIFPSAEGANSFVIDYGDGSGVSNSFTPGGNATHVYAEGTYEVTIIATNLAGQSAEGTQTLVVSFSAPENLEITATINQANPFLVSVSATADNAAAFDVYFGEDPNADATPMMIGETVSYEYAAVGTYTITVVALSGGVESTTGTVEVTIVNPLLMPLDFESATLDYSFTFFGGGDGVWAPIVNNPNPSGINTTGKVAYYTKPVGSETWAGTFVTLNESIDFSETTTIGVDVYSPIAGAPVILKVENAADGNIAAEATVNTTVANAWETLYFTLPVDGAQTYEKIVLFFNFGVSGTGETYYFDNIELSGAPTAEIPADFEGASGAAFQFLEFGGAPTSVVANPFVNSANPSATVVSMLKASGSQTWAGAYAELDTPVDFASHNQISMKVYSPVANAQVILKFENLADANINVEASAYTTVANAWETLTFTYTGVNTSNVYQRLVVFFNFGVSGTGETYYFDDVAYADGNTSGLPEVPLTFEEADIPFSWIPFGGATSQVIDNPSVSGINTSAKVTQFFKASGAETWAGSSIILGVPIDLSASQTVKMKVWSPQANTPVLLKLEENATTYSIEVLATTTVTNQWEELTFDFTGVSMTNTIDVISVFVDFGNSGSGTTYYFDDIIIN